jgi:molecular chaperone Hsp33
MTNDRLERFTFEKKALRGEYVYLETSIQTILKQHAYSAPMKKLLAESLAIVSLLSAMIKLDGRISLHFKGKGDLKLLLAQCNSRHEVRGLIKYEQGKELSYDELIQCMKEGLLVVMLEFDAHPGNPYQGIIQWTGNNLTDAIEVYFENSEQLLTRVWLHYNSEDETIAGCMLQALPNPESPGEVNLDFFKIATAIQHTWQQQDHLQEVETLLKTACPQDDIQLFAKSTMQFKCTCSRSHSEQAIKLLGQHEAQDEIEKNGAIVVTCDFCTEIYSFDKIDIAALFKDTPSDSSPHSLH